METNPTHRGDELVRDLAHTECQFLVTDSTYREEFLEELTEEMEVSFKARTAYLELRGRAA